MSCIVGIVGERGEVFIGADSGAFSDDAAEVRRDPKLFERGPFVVGAIGSYRMIQLLRYSLVVPRRKRGQDVFEFMVLSFSEAARTCLKTGGFSSRDKDDGNEIGGSFLVGYEGRLFRVDDGFDVAEIACGFDAIGRGGGSQAIGALWAQELMLATARKSKRDFNFDAKARVVDALIVAERSTHFVRRPFVVLSLPRATNARKIVP